MIKKLYFVGSIGFIGLCLMGFYLREPFKSYLLTSSLEHYIQKEFGQPLMYEQLIREKGRIIYIKPQLKEQGLFKGEKLIVDYDWRLSTFKANISVGLEEPQFHFRQEHFKIGELAPSQSYLKSQLKWLEIRPSLVIKSGKLSWSSVHLSHSLHFDLAFQGQSGEKNNSLQLQIEGLKAGVDISWGEERELFSVNLQGEVGEFTSLLPEAISQLFSQYFEGHALQTKLKLIHAEKRIELQGITRLYDAFSEEISQIAFGVDMEQMLKEVPQVWFQMNHLPLRMSKVTLEDLSGKAYLYPDTLKIDQLEAYCQEVYFAGKLELDYGQMEAQRFHLCVHSPTMIGKVSQVKALLTQLQTAPLIDLLCLEGDFSGRGLGLELDLSTSPHEVKLKTSIQGNISHGALLLESHQASLKDLWMDIDYQHADQLLQLSDIQGTLLVGKPSCMGEYSVGGHHITLKGNGQPEMAVDLFVKDQDHEILRLVARTETNSAGQQEVVLNQVRSHIAQAHPSVFHCAYNAEGIQTFRLASTFELGSLLEDLRGFQKSGLYRFSHKLVSELKQLNLESIFTIPNEIVKTDALSANGKRTPNLGHYHFWDAPKGELDLTITYQPAQQSFHYELISRELEIQSFPHRLQLKGRVQGKKWFLDKLEWDRMKAFAEWYAEDHRLIFNSLGFSDGVGLSLGLQGEVDLKDNSYRGKLNWGELLLQKQQLFPWPIEGNLTASGNLQLALIDRSPWIESSAQLKWNTDDKVKLNHHRVEGSGSQGQLKGTASLQINPQHFALSLHLEDGVYKYQDDLIHLFSPQVHLQDQTLEITTKMDYLRQPAQLIAQTRGPAFADWRISVIDSAQNSLKTEWIKNPAHQWTLLSAYGQFCGVSMDLMNLSAASQAGSRIQLGGKVEISHACPFLIEWSGSQGFEGVCRLEGCYILQGGRRHLFDSLTFVGHLSSQDLKFYGWRWGRLDTQAHIQSGRIELTDVQLEDPAATVRCERIIATQQPKWKIEIPEISVRNLKPALLRGSSPSPFLTPLTIKRLELHELSGFLNQPDTWTGRGMLHFQNTIRKQAENSLLKLPKELIHQIGLDSSVLNPVTGTLYFDLRQERFYLTKMKDVYSEGRGAKFYLADHNADSWVGLNGDLSLQLRMKQYSLLFKIAELFTLSVHGNLQNPVYSLQRQAHTR